MASVTRKPNAPPLYLTPTEIYSLPSSPDAAIALRIATGGAGQSGLLRALALAFIEHQTTTTSHPPFSIAWCASDTSLSFNSLALRGADVAITYHSVAERIALAQGIATHRTYAWRDHWLLVGPKTNPAHLPFANEATPNLTIQELFMRLLMAAIETADTRTPVRFLSRYDKSAANIKESFLWTSIGQTPWSEPYSTWYHRFVAFPYEALETAARLGEYTLTDRGSWYGVDAWVRESMDVFMEGGDGNGVDGSGGDGLLNPAHALVGADAGNRVLAVRFVEWLGGDGGQEVIRTFASREGVVLYSVAPPKTGVS